MNTASIDEALVGHAVWDCEFTSNTQRRLICDDFEGWAKDRVQILTDVMPIRCQRCMNNAAPWLCVTSEIGCLPPRAPIQGALGTGAVEVQAHRGPMNSNGCWPTCVCCSIFVRPSVSLRKHISVTTDDDGVHMGDVGDDDHEDSATSILQEDVFKEMEATHQAAENDRAAVS